MAKNQDNQQTIYSILSTKKAVIFDLFHTLTSLESTWSTGPWTSQLQVDAHERLFVGDGGSMELKGAKNVGMSTVMITGIIKEIWPDRIDERKIYADFVLENLNEFLPEEVRSKTT
jgi:FMN phosphatase YigB (HAD superfamily)